MLITKIFKFEGSHRVIDCTAERCKKSFHGHSYVVEIKLSADKLDNAGMVCDFHLLKTIKMFIDSFDHCHLMWSKDDPKTNEFFKTENDRWIELPVNPSCENISLFILWFIEKILKATEFNNGEGDIGCVAVKVHETVTGSATAFQSDTQRLPVNMSFSFSKGVTKDWSADLVHFISEIGTVHPEKKYFINPKIELQVK